jgi:cell division septal protein FtsQ
MAWFKSKPRNRRLESRHVLDVKMRTDPAREQRARHILLALAAASAVAFSLYVLWRSGQYVVDRLIFDNQRFAIRTIDVRSDGGLTAGQVRAWSGVRVGENLLALDLLRVQRNLQFVPAIRSVAIERVPPDTLRIHVTRREPLARALPRPPGSAGAAADSPLYLDESGFVMALEPALRRVLLGTNETLPVLTGFNPAELRPGRTVESRQIRAALRYLGEFDRCSMAGLVTLHSIEVGGEGVIEVTTSTGSRITFAAGGFERQLNRWRLVHDLGSQQGLHIRSLDLAVTNYPPLVWMEFEASPTNGPGSRPARPPANPRRNNV